MKKEAITLVGFDMVIADLDKMCCRGRSIGLVG